jgi:hypothetical protein
MSDYKGAVIFAAALTQRKPRADAERNRDRVLEVTKEAFTRSGADASLDDIAKRPV